MNKLTLIFISLIMSILVTAQEKPKQKEVGLVFSNLNNFGLTYKTGSSKSLWRYNTLFISGSNTDETADSLEINQRSSGFGVKFGKEYRKVIVTNFEFRYGADLSFTFSNSSGNYNDKSVGNNDMTSKRTTYQPGINLVLGFNYVFKDRLVIGAELLPYFSYITGKSKETSYRTNEEIEKDISGYAYGLSNTSALLSLSYRF